MKFFNRVYIDELTAIERNKLYNKGKYVDRIPCSLISAETGCTLYNVDIRDIYWNHNALYSVSAKIIEDFGADSISLGPGLRGLAEAVGSSVSYPKNNICYINSPILDKGLLIENLNDIDPYSDKRLPILLKAMNMLKKNYGKEYIIGNDVGGPLSMAIGLRGTEEFIVDTIRDKKTVDSLLEYCVEQILIWVDAVYTETGIMPGIAEPMLSNQIFGKNQFENIFRKHLEKLVIEIENITGAKPGIHICGESSYIWEDIVDLGFNGFSIDNCENLKELKKRVGDRISISGNIPPVSVLRNGTLAEVESSVIKCIEAGSDSMNGYTISPGCQVPLDTPIENLKMYMISVRKYGKDAKKGELPLGLKVDY